MAEVGAKRIVEIDPQNGTVTEIAGNLLPVYEAVLAQTKKTIPARGSALPAMSHQTAPTRGSGANWTVKTAAMKADFIKYHQTVGELRRH